jgi:virulence factor
MAKMRVAVVGLGTIARDAHLPVLRGRDDIEIAAVCDPDPERGARVPGVAQYADVDEMIADGAAVDAALVLTPEHLHAAVVAQLLTAGVPTFCEKPLAPSAREANELAAVAERTGVPLMVGYNRRFAPVYVSARAEIGDPAITVGIFEKCVLGRGYRGSVENLVHMVDLARFFFGEATRVEAHAQFDDPYREHSLSAMVTFDSGATALILGHRGTGVWTERVAVHGDGNRIVVEPPDSLALARHSRETVTLQSTVRHGFSSPVETLGFAAQAEHFFAAARGDGILTQNDAVSAARTQELMERILEAAGLPLQDTRAEPALGVP